MNFSSRTVPSRQPDAIIFNKIFNLMDDLELMGKALEQAKLSLEAGEVPVGCIFYHPAT